MLMAKMPYRKKLFKDSSVAFLMEISVFLVVVNELRKS